MSVLPVGFGSAAGGGGGYQIERSLRFNSADTAYLNRTPASAGNRRTFTWSGWVKRSALSGSTRYFLFAAGSFAGSTNTSLTILNDSINIYWGGAGGPQWTATAVLRDPSAWYHLVFAFDTTQATFGNRLKLYVNGVQSTVWSLQETGGLTAQNSDLYINNNQQHNLGASGTPGNYFDGYLTEVNFVDSPVLVGSTTNASTTVTLTTGTTTNIGIGWNVGGTNIPSGATVSSITNSTQFVISSAATATGSSINIGVTPPVSAFGETDSSTGVWKPKAFSGSYGTNGFELSFADNSGTTSTTLGKDYSGNGNNWTPNLFSVNAGVGNDSLVDTPTSYGTDTGAGGSVRGNYCTMNPLTVPTLPTLANGNLDVSVSATGVKIAQGTFQFPSSGKWYYECTFNNASSSVNGMFIGITSPTRSPNATRSTAGAYFFYASSSGLLNSNGTDIATGLSAISANEVFKVAVDIDNSKVWIGRGSIWYNSSGGTTGDPAAGTNPTFSISAIGLTPMSGFDASSVSLSMNFGQRTWAQTCPSGFKALCTQNFTTPTIGATSTTQANKYMDVTLYTGNQTVRSITNSGSMQPDFVWDKLRSGANSHRLFDAVRGVEKALYSNLTNIEATETGTITAFNSNGFSLGTNTETNTTGSTYVAWQWNAGGSNQTISVGQYATSPANVPSIASTVRANTTSGFSIVTASALGTSPVTVGHGLGVTPSLIIGKVRDVASTNWYVYSASFAASDYLVLNSNAAKATSSNIWDIAPTSTVFTVGNPQNGWAGGNSGTKTYVFYCFAPVAGYSAFGTYTGNNSTDGPFIYLGFRPKFWMVKRTDSTGDWYIYDSTRSSYNAGTETLAPSQNFGESSFGSLNYFDLLSNGMKIRQNSTNGYANVLNATYIYAAFAESPFKYSLAR